MATFDLATLARRQRNIRRPEIALREIVPPGVMATDLYRACYLPVVEAWSRGADRIIAEYGRTLAEMTTDAPADVDRDIGSVEEEVGRLYVQIDARLRDWLVRFETWHRGKWRGAVLSATGVDLSTLIGPEDVAETLDTLMRRNAGLIRNISDEARGRISDAVYRGLSQRRAARDVAKEIRGAVDMARSRSIRVASDQMAKAASALDTERMRQAGIDTWEWRHSGKLHAREEHRARHGRRYTFAAPPADMPGELPYCGCRKQGIVEFEEGAAPAPPPPPPPAPPPRAFRSPIDASVTEESIRVGRRLDVAKEMSRDFDAANRDVRYSQVQEFRGRRPADFGRAQFSAAFDDETASMLRALKPELDDLADQLQIPRLRGFKSLSGTKASADMGDGVMGINPNVFNTHAARVGGRRADEAVEALTAQRDELVVRMRAIKAEVDEIAEQLALLAPVEPRYQALLARKADLFNEHGDLRKRWMDIDKKIMMRRNFAEQKVSEWSVGDPSKERPYTTTSYFSGIDAARSTLFHEFGHHLHQYLNKAGPRRTHGEPPLERDLRTLFAQAMARGSGRQASTYATTNRFEWFAENFSLFVMGRNELVDEGLLPVLKKLFDGSY